MSNREERERLRQERLAAQAQYGSSERRRLIIGYVVAGVLALAVLAGLVAVIASGGGDDGASVGDECENASIQTDFGVFEDYQCDNREGTSPPEIQFGVLEDAAREAGCELHLDQPDEGRTHFTDENQGSYKTNPPTSGDHYGAPDEPASGPVADGAYTSTPPESRLVHSMEHGRVEIRYAPDLPEDQQLELKGVFDDDPGGLVMFPDPDLPNAVAFSAWQNYVGCKAWDPLVLDVARDFILTYRGNGPENVHVP